MQVLIKRGRIKNKNKIKRNKRKILKKRKKITNSLKKRRNNNKTMKMKKHLAVRIPDVNVLDRFKAYRRVLYLLGKTTKYTFWAACVLFTYHMYLIKKV